MKVAVLTDSGSAMTLEQAQEKGLYLVPLQVIDNEVAYQDGVDMSTMQLYDLLRKEHTPKTSMPITEVISETMRKIKEDGYDHILAVPLSSGLSGTFNAIRMCAEEEHIPLTILENYTTCNLEGYLAVLAKQYADQGYEPAKIVEEVSKKVKTSGTLIVPNDIQHLKRGGRLTPIAAAMASMLKIKPILLIDPSTEGKIDVCDKVRTEKKAMDVAIAKTCEQMKDKEGIVYVIHSDAEKRAEEVKAAILAQCPKVNVIIDYISAVISAHTGMDCIAIQYIEK